MQLYQRELEGPGIPLLLWVVKRQVLAEGILLILVVYGCYMFQGATVSRTPSFPPVSGLYRLLTLQAELAVSFVHSSTAMVVEPSLALSREAQGEIALLVKLKSW